MLRVFNHGGNECLGLSWSTFYCNINVTSLTGKQTRIEVHNEKWIKYLMVGKSLSKFLVSDPLSRTLSIAIDLLRILLAHEDGKNFSRTSYAAHSTL